MPPTLLGRVAAKAVRGQRASLKAGSCGHPKGDSTLVCARGFSKSLSLTAWRSGQLHWAHVEVCTRLVPPGGSRGEFISSPCLAPASFLHSLAHDLFLISPSLVPSQSLLLPLWPFWHPLIRSLQITCRAHLSNPGSIPISRFLTEANLQGPFATEVTVIGSREQCVAICWGVLLNPTWDRKDLAK